MIVTKKFELPTQGDTQIIDLTGQVAGLVGGSSVTDGIVTVFVTATTAAVAIMEYEPGLVADLRAALDRLVPRQGLIYQHNVLNNDTNGHAHTRAIFFGPSLVVPVGQGRPMLGQWQSLVLIDLDSRPRQREVILQIMGE